MQVQSSTRGRSGIAGCVTQTCRCRRSLVQGMPSQRIARTSVSQNIITNSPTTLHFGGNIPCHQTTYAAVSCVTDLMAAM